MRTSATGQSPAAAAAAAAVVAASAAATSAAAAAVCTYLIVFFVVMAPLLPVLPLKKKTQELAWPGRDLVPVFGARPGRRIKL